MPKEQINIPIRYVMARDISVYIRENTRERSNSQTIVTSRCLDINGSAFKMLKNLNRNLTTQNL